MTQEAYNALPALLRRGLFLELTGLQPEDIKRLVELRQLRVFRRPSRVYTRNGIRYKPKRSYALYPKREVLRFDPIQ